MLLEAAPVPLSSSLLPLPPSRSIPCDNAQQNWRPEMMICEPSGPGLMQLVSVQLNTLCIM